MTPEASDRRCDPGPGGRGSSPSCAGGEMTVGCLCSHAPASRKPSLIFFPFLQGLPFAGGLGTHSGPESTTLNSMIIISGSCLKLRGGLACWETEAQRGVVTYPKSHSECECVAELDWTRGGCCWFFPPCSLPAGRRLQGASCQDSGKHIFSLCPHRTSSRARQAEREGLQPAGASVGRPQSWGLLWTASGPPRAGVVPVPPVSLSRERRGARRGGLLESARLVAIRDPGTLPYTPEAPAGAAG